MTSYKSTVGESQNVEGSAKGDIAIAKAEGKVGRGATKSGEKTYDPFWTHAYTFLRDLEENFAVPLEQGRIGSLVKFEAFIQFMDLKLMRNLWEPAAKAFVHSTNPVQPPSRNKRRQQAKPEMSEPIKFGLELLKQAPHAFHMTFLSESSIRLWAAVQPDNLTISSEDLTMKFGATLDGLWTVIGIVDAAQGKRQLPLPVNPVIDGVVQAMISLREFIGRPEDHFGITPIAIYTPIRGLAEIEATSDPSDI